MMEKLFCKPKAWHTRDIPCLSPLTAGVWSCPVTTGERPPPCSDLTFTAVDDRRAVVFGGRIGEQGRMNDVYIIDLATMVCIVSVQHSHMYSLQCNTLLMQSWSKLNKSGGGS